ncbi:MAG: plastocyanin/azurin family copper-binding protein [Kiloniellales bacterium]|nr:plastocyanin/azurin family copper-binding protein [Kiloniellales bacterium]
MKRSAIALLALVLLVPGGCALLETAPKRHIVRITTDLDNLRMAFQPKVLVIRPGDTVTWVNEAEMDHNVMTYPDGFPKGARGFESPYLTLAGETWSHTFSVEGSYEYHCLPHLIMGMHAIVIVGEATVEGGFHVPSKAEVIAYRDRLFEYFDEGDAEDLMRAEHFMKSEAKTAE